MPNTLRTESGAPVADNQNSQTAGPEGPILLQDQHLSEKLARFNRERIPERVVHAVGSGAYGHFTVTTSAAARFTRMRMMSTVGKRTSVFARFSTVAGSKGAPDSVRELMVSKFSLDVTQADYALGYVFDIVLRGPKATRFE